MEQRDIDNIKEADKLLKALTGNPMTRLSKIIHYVEGIKYVFSNGTEGKYISNNDGEHTEYSDVPRLARRAIKQLEDFANEANMKGEAHKEYRMQRDAGEAHSEW